MSADRPVALITGAAQGIGTAIAYRLAKDGFSVALTAETDLTAAAEAVTRTDAPVWTEQADLRDPTAITGVVERVCDHAGRLDVLVNNAGWSYGAPLEEIDDGDLQAALAVNLVAPILAIRAAVAALSVRGGAVVNVSSILSFRGVSGTAVYAASKGGLNALTRQLAVELASRRIRVNAVVPGAIEVTRFVEQPGYTSSDAAEEIPWPRQGQPSDVAGAVSFLASADAEFISGQLLGVDGAAGAAHDPDA